MILRFIVFIIAVIIPLVIGFLFIKDLGQNRIEIERKIKADAIKNNSQALGQKGPNYKK